MKIYTFTTDESGYDFYETYPDFDASYTKTSYSIPEDFIKLYYRFLQFSENYNFVGEISEIL